MEKNICFGRNLNNNFAYHCAAKSPFFPTVIKGEFWVFILLKTSEKSECFKKYQKLPLDRNFLVQYSIQLTTTKTLRLENIILKIVMASIDYFYSS